MAGNPLLSMMGGNNPLMQIINMARSGKGNPMQLFQQMASNNPQMQQILNMANGKDESEMKDLITKTAKERGVDLTQLATQLGVPPEIAAKYGIKMTK